MTHEVQPAEPDDRGHALGRVAGGRIEYLRRWAVFHEREAERYAELVFGQQNVSREKLELLISLARGDNRDSTEPPDVISININGREFDFRRDHSISLNKHRQQAAAFRKALHWRDE